jgi:hypothetical protein
MSALPPNADMFSVEIDVGKVPLADMPNRLTRRALSKKLKLGRVAVTLAGIHSVLTVAVCPLAAKAAAETAAMYSFMPASEKRRNNSGSISLSSITTGRPSCRPSRSLHRAPVGRHLQGLFCGRSFQLSGLVRFYGAAMMILDTIVPRFRTLADGVGVRYI